MKRILLTLPLLLTACPGPTTTPDATPAVEESSTKPAPQPAAPAVRAEDAAQPATPAVEADDLKPNFVGTWAASADGCSLDPSNEEAPFVFHAQGYDQHETHCTFTTLKQDATDTYIAEVTCSVQGDTLTDTEKFQVRGDTLILRPGDSPVTLLRCPSTPNNSPDRAGQLP